MKIRIVGTKTHAKATTAIIIFRTSFLLIFIASPIANTEKPPLIFLSKAALNLTLQRY